MLGTRHGHTCCTHVLLTTTYAIGTIAISLQVRTLRHREVKELLQGHTAPTWRSWRLSPGSLTCRAQRQLLILAIPPCYSKSLRGSMSAPYSLIQRWRGQGGGDQGAVLGGGDVGVGTAKGQGKNNASELLLLPCP